MDDVSNQGLCGAGAGFCGAEGTAVVWPVPFEVRVGVRRQEENISRKIWKERGDEEGSVREKGREREGGGLVAVLLSRGASQSLQTWGRGDGVNASWGLGDTQPSKKWSNLVHLY